MGAGNGRPASAMRRTCIPCLAGLALSLAACFLLPTDDDSVDPLSRQDLDVRTTPHRVGLVESGWRALLLRIHLIRSARHTIDLQTFIWREDEVGKFVADELVTAARRGVRVRILTDGFHTRVSHRFAARLATADTHLDVRHYNPSSDQLTASWADLFVSGLAGFEMINQHSHDKVMTVDDEWTLLGGRNIENTYYDHASGMNFKDREVLFTGSAVADAAASFERFWSCEFTVPSDGLQDIKREIERGPPPWPRSGDELGIGGLRAEVDASLGESPTAEQFVAGGMYEVRGVLFCCDPPGKQDSFDDQDEEAPANHVTRVLRGLLRDAEESVLIQTPYLVLTDRAIRLLEDMRAEHPEISLRGSTNSLASTDVFPAHAATYRQTRLMLEHLGMELHEFKAVPQDITSYIERHASLVARTGRAPTLCLHSKAVVIDGEVAGVGSHNLNPRSENWNTEVMLLVWDRDFAEHLARSIERDMAPRNSWIVCKTERIPLASNVQEMLEALSTLAAEITEIDLWPSFYASCFELRDGADPVPPGHPSFFANHREVGRFPGLSMIDEKVVLTRVFKTLGGFWDPLL